MNNSKNDFVCMSVCLGMIAIFMFAMGCNSEKVGTDVDEAFLLVENADGTSTGQPSVRLTNVGTEKVFVTGLGFVLNADSALTVAPPAGCDTMYEDMVDERVLRIVCNEGNELEIGPDGEIIVDVDVQGPWNRLDLVSVTAENENGEVVYNDLSSEMNQPFWTPPL
jgi:hypothetical protein